VSAIELPILTFKTRAAWRKWLDKNHSSAEGVWLQYAKKGSGIQTIAYVEAVEVALCYGWIDGLTKTIDDDYYKQRFTPRRKRSNWSKTNVERALALIESGDMQPAGRAEVERAKADGRWDAAYN
jgi:uncharacterized protein YdeI (YjbR/CyaY-like superfamily)